jgi:uncharacterized membrane protein (DUF106 family)
MAGIYSQMFNLGGLTGITSISQIPFIAVGGFGLFLYLLYAGKVNKQIGEKKEGAIGMFIVFAFIMDIFYLHDVWLVTILGTIAGVYATLAFAGVFGAVKKMGKLGYRIAEKVKEKRSETKAKKKEEQESAITDFQAEVNEEREESVLLLNPEFRGTVDKVRSKNSYFFNATYGNQNIPALTHILTYLRRITQIIRQKEVASAHIAKLESKELPNEKKEAKAEAEEVATEEKLLPAASKEIQEMISEARLLPAQMRGQVQTAVVELEQAEGRERKEVAEESQEKANEAAIQKLTQIQEQMAKKLNPLQNRMLKQSRFILKNLIMIETAMAAGGQRLVNAAKKYPPAKFFQDFNVLYQQHEQVKALMAQAIQIEINDTMWKIKKLMWSKDINYQELDEDKLLAQSEKIKANIDRMLGGKAGTKKYQQDETKFAEIGKEMGIEQAAGATDNEYLRKMQAYLNFLNQMQAAMAASK